MKDKGIGVPHVVRILGVSLANVDMNGALAHIEDLAHASGGQYVVTANVDHMVAINKDEHFRDVYAKSSLRLADGAPLVLLSRMMGTPLRARVTGADLLPAACSMAARRGLRVYILGGKPGVPEQAAVRLTRANPGLMVCGTHSPAVGFESDEGLNQEVLDRIQTARPDLLFVCLGAPKQEKWTETNIDALGDVVALCVGAAVDFAAGHVRRAPKVVQRLGLEWLFRLGQEPGRLWRRYLVQDLPFIRLALSEVVRVRLRPNRQHVPAGRQ